MVAGQKLGPFIDGNFKETPVEFEVFKPCTEQVIAKVGLSTEEDVNAAVNSSLKAADTWANLSGHKRACHICKWVYLVGKVLDQNRERCMYSQLQPFHFLFFGKYLLVHYHYLACHSPV
jgi:acyl-CoA reductase-like NAD-dependent aldehyde dehydrogenase